MTDGRVDKTAKEEDKADEQYERVMRLLNRCRFRILVA